MQCGSINWKWSPVIGEKAPESQVDLNTCWKVQIFLILMAVTDFPFWINKPNRHSSWKYKFTVLKFPTALSATSWQIRRSFFKKNYLIFIFFDMTFTCHFYTRFKISDAVVKKCVVFKNFTRFFFKSGFKFNIALKFILRIVKFCFQHLVFNSIKNRWLGAGSLMFH